MRNWGKIIIQDYNHTVTSGDDREDDGMSGLP